MRLMNKWLENVRASWQVYRSRLIRVWRDEGMDDVEILRQQVDRNFTLDEFAELVFTEGFAAGERHAKNEMFK